jgi:hypothetical protein
MPKATLSFDLNDYEEKKSHLRACKADAMLCAVEKYREHLRRRLKYEALTEAETILLTSEQDTYNGLMMEFYD